MTAPAFKPGPETQVNFNQIDTAAVWPLGTEVETANGKEFKYVEFLDSVAYLEGHVVTLAGGTIDEWKVTNDRAGGSGDVATFGHIVIGVVPALSTMPAPTGSLRQFGWVQTEGECVVLGTYASGDYLKPHATVDGTSVVSGYTAAKADFNIFAKAISTTVAILTGL